MKKTYTKPTLFIRDRLGAVTAVGNGGNNGGLTNFSGSLEG